MAEPNSVFELTRGDLALLLADWGFKPVHAARIWSQVYLAGARSFDGMPDLPPRVAARLAAALSLDLPAVVRESRSTDGFTRKFLLALRDGRTIEMVLMRFTGRLTACVSSQVGCAAGCVFCATGQMGFSRQLTAGEIVSQVILARALLGPAATAGGRLRNVVLMGMGEPLHNYDAVMRAASILRDQGGPAIGARQITVSTVGIVPGIVRMADEAQPVQLAVSLHAATQEERAALVPIATRWPLDALVEACRYYTAKRQCRIFFEWALIAGRNDTPAQARAVGRLLRGIPAQVNLIPLNPTAGYDGAPADHAAARRFQQILAEHSLPSTVRQRRGIDIAAGCGQLAIASR